MGREGTGREGREWERRVGRVGRDGNGKEGMGGRRGGGKRGKGEVRGAFRQIKIYDYTPGSFLHMFVSHATSSSAANDSFFPR